MADSHLFSPYPGGRTPRSCVRCGRPPEDPVHIQIDTTVDQPPQAHSRLARTELLMRVAELYAQRSSCTRGHVGAVIAMEGRVLSSGYNGAPAGMQQCDEVGCDVPGSSGDEDLGCQRTIHAEANAIVWAARLGVPTLGCDMYSTHSPCASCARLIVAAGISRFYYRNDYRLARLDLLDKACIPTEKL
jgi:dCMP deaminase